MKAVVFACLLVAITAKILPFNPDYDKDWEIFKAKFNKTYEKNEELARRLIWEEKLAAITKHNIEYDLGLHTFTAGLNQFSDMTHQEFVQKMNGLKRRANIASKSVFTFTRLSNVVLPDTVDWREEGYVTPVKNQGQCGSCWAFSATGSLEGQHKKKTGKLVSLSEQNLVDCSEKEGNDGCNGGVMDSAFEYVKVNKGIDTEESYPYEEIEDTCRFKRSSVGATCTGYVDVTSGDEEALKQAVATIGPISVGVDASKDSFMYYSGGVYYSDECSSTDLDHGVLAVGYGTTKDGNDYWLVKNSWGTSWGINGYIMMARNRGNMCGIATNSSFPLM
ncbi:procathepsin L-like [Centruroides vittatus]|uniref:procathepsin L-like n=1 Tax=Centruroides vittatus TaxID=120091 RepID=UPI00350F6C0D